MRPIATLCILILMLLATSLSGQTISTQGVLRDSDGHSVEDGAYVMTFSIFDLEAGGTLLWGPSTQTVQVENGIYQVVLGTDTPITSLNSDGSNYLQISVGSETMTPRLRLNVSPYELANLTGSSNALPGSGNVGIGTTSPQAKLSIVATGDNVDLLHFDENGDDLQEFTFQGMFAGSAASGNALKLRSQWMDKIMFWRGDGNVGIGTSNPGQKLDVDGNIRSTGTISNGATNVGQYMEKGNATTTSLRFDSDNYRIYSGGSGASGTVMTMNESGKVGVGTTAPDVKLHVNGGSDVALAGGGFIQSGESTGANIAIDNNEIMARNNGSATTLYLNADGGTVEMGGNAIIDGSADIGSWQDQDLTSTGHVNMGGFIMQWGVFECTLDGTQTVTFPIAFPSACFGVYSNRKESNINSPITANGWTTTNFTVNRDDDIDGSQTVNWFAIGH
jgi:hypothetical protein